MTVGTELAPGPNAVDITPTKDAGIMKEIKVIIKKMFLIHAKICPLLESYNGFLAGKFVWFLKTLMESCHNLLTT